MLTSQAGAACPTEKRRAGGGENACGTDVTARSGVSTDVMADILDTTVYRLAATEDRDGWEEKI